MKCTCPTWYRKKIKVKWQQKTKKGQVIEKEKSYDFGKPLLVACGQCMACRLNRAREWAFRLRAELPYHSGASFINLTYDEENLPTKGTLVKKDLQKFFKRFRKNYGNEFKIKYFACGEYGEVNFRPHYHIIMFGVNPKDIYENSMFGKVSRLVKGSRTYEKSSLWPFGSVLVGTVTKDSILYVTKYVTKKMTGEKGKLDYGDLQPPFQIQSLGLGLQYAKDNYQQLYENSSVVFNGQEIGLPRYYKKKLRFDEVSMMKKAENSYEEFLNEVESKGLNVTDVYIQRNKNILAKVNLSKKRSVD